MSFEKLLDQAGRVYNVDPALLRAQMMAESGGNPNAVSNQNAQGAMQIIPSTQKALGVTDPYDPAQSINGAAKLMAENLDRYGNVADAVRAYHGGTDQANWGPKTQAYAQKVLNSYGGAAPQPQGNQQMRTAQQPQDDLANDFAMPSAKAAPVSAPAQAPAMMGGIPQAQAQQAPADDLANDFMMPSAKAPTAAVAPQSPQQAAMAQQQPINAAQAPNPHQGGILNGIYNYAKDAINPELIGGAAVEGLKRGVDTPVEYLTKWMGGDYNAQVATDKARRDAYDATNPGAAATVARLGGEMAGPAGEMLGAGRIATAGGNALLSGMRATEAGSAVAPALASAGNFISGNGGFLSRVANMSGQGAVGAALTSGGGNPIPVDDQMAVGAALGAAIPVVGGLVSGAGKVAKGIYQGANRLAGGGQDAAINDLVGSAAQNASPALASLPKGATLDEIGQAANVKNAASQSNVLENALAGKSSGAPVGADFTQYIPGAPPPTLAQATGNSGIAEIERAMNSRNSAPFSAHEAATNAARGNFLQQIRGTPDTLAELQSARDTVTAPMREAALSNVTGPADAKPVADLIDNMLAGPDGKQSAVRAALNKAKVGLFDPAGNLETDPSMLYGVRKEINNLIDPLAGSPTSDTKLAAAQLGKVKDALDSVIEPVAPGFGDYIKTFADMSKPIEAQRFLQSRDLTDATGTQFSLNKTKQLMLAIQKMQSAPGANPAKSITPEQMSGLQALHADLQRQANSQLGIGKNSATAQLLNGNSLINGITGNGALAQFGPHTLGASVGGMVAGPLGAAAGGAVGHLAGSAMNSVAEARSAELNSKLIDLLLGKGGPESLNMLMPKAQQGTSNGFSELLGRGLGAASTTGIKNK